MTDNYAGHTQRQRLAVVIWRIAVQRGDYALPTATAAGILNLTDDAAAQLLTDMQAVIPIRATAGGWVRDYPAQPTRDPRPTDSLERAAVLAWAFGRYEARLTTTQAARLVGSDYEHTRRLLDDLSGVLPVYLDAGIWQVCAETWRPRYTARDNCCFQCGGVEGLRTGRVQGWPVLWCKGCEAAYRELQEAR